MIFDGDEEKIKYGMVKAYFSLSRGYLSTEERKLFHWCKRNQIPADMAERILSDLDEYVPSCLMKIFDKSNHPINSHQAMIYKMEAHSIIRLNTNLMKRDLLHYINYLKKEREQNPILRTNMNYKKKIKSSVNTKALKAFAKQLRKTARVTSSSVDFDYDDVQLDPNGPTYDVAGSADYEMTYEPETGDGWNEPREGGYFYMETFNITSLEASQWGPEDDPHSLTPVTDPALLQALTLKVTPMVEQKCNEAAEAYEPDYDEPDRDDDY